MADVVVVTGTPPASVISVQETVEAPVTLVTEGGRVGPKGQDGKAGIIVSSTPPDNPVVNDLWLQI